MCGSDSAGVGRTLLSDAFDLDFALHHLLPALSGVGLFLSVIINVKGVGQECPTHTGLFTQAYPHLPAMACSTSSAV